MYAYKKRSDQCNIQGSIRNNIPNLKGVNIHNNIQEIKHHRSNLKFKLICNGNVRLFYSSDLKVLEGMSNIKSSHPELFCKKLVLKNFAKFTGKHLRWSLFFKKFSALQPATLIKKKRVQHKYFPMNFEKILRATFLKEWLFL